MFFDLGKKCVETETRMVGTRGRGGGERKWRDVDQRVQTSSEKINEFWGQMHSIVI